MPRTTINNVVDPVTGLTQRGGLVRVTQDNLVRVTQSTGEPPGGLNTAPGSTTPLPSGQSIGLPYGFLTIPITGPLT